jgi:hypothetical protein
MRRRARLNLLLLAAVAVGGWLVWQDLATPPVSAPVERVTALDPGQVRHLVITRESDGRELEFLREAGRWWLQREPRLPADRLRVTEVLRLVDAPSETSYALAAVSLAELGLEPPRARVRADGIELRIGAQEPLRYRRYVASGQRVHLVADTAYVHLGADWTAFVDPAPLAGVPAPVEATTGSAEGESTLTADQVAAWRELAADTVRATIAPEGDAMTLTFQFEDRSSREMVAWRKAASWQFAWRDGVVSYAVAAERGPDLGLE